MLLYLDKYNVTNKSNTMTADNISTKAVIGRAIGFSDSIKFGHTTRVHGCVAQMINLSAQAGLKVCGELLEDGEDTDHVR